MRKYRKVEELVVKEKICTEIMCDMCGSKAEHPEQDIELAWEYCGAGLAGGAITFTSMTDGDFEIEHRDICPDCAKLLLRAVDKFRTSRDVQDFFNKMRRS
jgi:hypothetical protein